MTRNEAINKLQVDHLNLIKALNLFSAAIEYSPAWVDRHDGKGPVRSSLVPNGAPIGILHGLMIHTPNEKLRDIAKSLVYRFESLQYHLILILNLQEEYESIAIKPSLDQQSHASLWNLHYQAHFLFDDILFNLCSLLDYLGALMLGTLLKQVRLIIGEDRIDEKHFDWGKLSIYSSASEPRTRIDTVLEDLSNKILDHDKSYVKKLFNYRNKVIHLYVRPSVPDLIKFRILIPNSFVSEVGFESLAGNHNIINLHEGCIDVIHRVTTTLVDVMNTATNLLTEGVL
jgi:hypothetical protein